MTYTVDQLIPNQQRNFMLFERKIVPMLRERGLSGDEVDRLTYVNPMLFFLGDVGA
jgi:hypothetical protein